MRVIASFFIVPIFFSFVNSNAGTPTITILNGTTTSQTGGIYTLEMEISPATKVLVDGTEVEGNKNNTYKTTVNLTNPTDTVVVYAKNYWKSTKQSITVTRALNETELAEAKKQQKAIETQKLAQQLVDEECQKDPECQKQKQEQQRIDEKDTL